MASEHSTAGDGKAVGLSDTFARDVAATRHHAGCDCPRCTGFQPGNTVGMTHGAKSLIQIQERAGEVAEGLREALLSERLYRPSFEPIIQLCSITLVRVERAALAIAMIDETAPSPLAAYVGPSSETLQTMRRDLGGWTTRARNMLAELGLTPTALARLAKDAGQAGRAARAIAELNSHLETTYHSENGS